MTMATDTRRAVDAPVVAAAVLFAVLAVVLESRYRLPLRLPGHRALPGALVLLLVADGLAPAVLLAVAAGLGALTAALAGAPLLAGVWVVPAALLALGRGRSFRTRAAIGVLCGLLFGLLRCFSLPGALHHTPQAMRLAGHLAFGGLGAAVAIALLAARHGGRGCASR